jgi:Spy/CpxP family protein refolding chaperone
MKKNNFLKVTLLMLLLAIAACSEKSGIIDQASSSKNTSGDYYLLEIEDGMNLIEDATLDKNMDFNSDFDSKGFYFDKRHERKSKFKGKGLKLGIVFSKLDLSDDQKESIKTIFAENRECVSVPFEQFREVAKEIMEAKKSDIQAIRDLVKAGELNRVEARAEIKIINEATREEIKNNEISIQAKEDICNCNTTMLENIELLLDEEQLSIWNEWLGKLPRDC